MAMIFAIYLFAVSLCVCKSQDAGTSTQPIHEGSARLLISKFMLSSYAVEGKDFLVEYNIYNIGDKMAVKVQLTDESLPSSEFDIVRGVLNAKWERIPPGTNVSHAIVARPKTFGYFNFSWAEVSYQPGEDSTELLKATSTAVGETYIYRLKDFERKFSPHLLDWGLFALMSLPSLAMPCLLWYNTRSKYVRLAEDKKRTT